MGAGATYEKKYPLHLLGVEDTLGGGGRVLKDLI